jgi:hypothetical protein
VRSVAAEAELLKALVAMFERVREPCPPISPSSPKYATLLRHLSHPVTKPL